MAIDAAGIVSASVSALTDKLIGPLSSTVDMIPNASTLTDALFGNSDTISLGNYQTEIPDPISSSYSDGPPNADSFITRPLISQVDPVDLSNRSSRSNSRISGLNCSLIEMLLQRTGLASLINDAELLLAEAIMFEEYMVKMLQGLFSLLKNPCSSTGHMDNIGYGGSSDYPTYRMNRSGGAVGDLATLLEEINTLQRLNSSASFDAFFKSVSHMFSGTIGAGSILKMIFQPDIDILTSAAGRTLPGVPTTLALTTYEDIFGSYNRLSKTANSNTLPLPSPINFNIQQNLFNGTLALSMANKTSAITSVMVHDSVFWNRSATKAALIMLPSVVKNGDTPTAKIIIEAVGGSSIPNKAEHVATLIKNAPSTSNGYTPDEQAKAVTDIQAIMTELDVTPEDVYGRGACDCSFNGKAVWNFNLLNDGLTGTAQQIVDPVTVQMAHTVKQLFAA